MGKDTSDAEEYRSLTTRPAKLEFRQRWVAQKLAEAERRQIKKTVQMESSETIGTYMSFRRIWDAEGSDRAGYQAIMP